MNIIKELYRVSIEIKDDGTDNVIRHEITTGEFIGW